MEFYIDFGSGYELIPTTEYNHSLSITLQNENFIRQRATLNGSITFWGQAKTDIETQQAADVIELPVKVEIEGNLQGEFYMQLFGSFDEKRNTATFGNFATNDYYTELLKVIDTKWAGNILTPANYLGERLIFRYDTEELIIQSLPTTETYANYATLYDIEQETAPLAGDPRWSYFAWYQSIPYSITENIHYYKTTISPIPATGYDPIQYLDTTYYMKNAGAVGSFDKDLGFSFYNLKDALDIIADKCGITTVSTYASVDSLWNVNRKFIGQTAKLLGVEILADDIQEISLSDMLKLIYDIWQIDWVLSNATTMFLVTPEDKQSATTTDLSTEAANSKAYVYAGENIPQSETIVFGNAFNPDFRPELAKITYARSNADAVINNNQLFSTDILNLLRNPGTVDKNGFTLLHCVYDAGVGEVVETDTPILGTGTLYNPEFATSFIIDLAYKVWRYASKASFNGATAEAVTKRPLYNHSGINLNLYPSEVGLSNTFVIDSVNHYGLSYNFDLKTRIGTIILAK